MGFSLYYSSASFLLETWKSFSFLSQHFSIIRKLVEFTPKLLEFLSESISENNDLPSILILNKIIRHVSFAYRNKIANPKQFKTITLTSSEQRRNLTVWSVFGFFIIFFFFYNVIYRCLMAGVRIRFVYDIIQSAKLDRK